LPAPVKPTPSATGLAPEQKKEEEETKEPEKKRLKKDEDA